MPETKANARRGRPPREPDAILRHVMTARGLGSQELATLVGCHRCHLTKILAGRVMPRAALALRLAAALGIDARDIWWPETEDHMRPSNVQ